MVIQPVSILGGGDILVVPSFEGIQIPQMFKRGYGPRSDGHVRINFCKTRILGSNMFPYPLESLSIEMNDIRSLHGVTFPLVKWLSLRYNLISSLEGVSFNQHPDHMTDNLNRRIEHGNALESIDLRHNFISSLDDLNLKVIPRAVLKRIDLVGNPIMDGMNWDYLDVFNLKTLYKLAKAHYETNHPVVQQPRPEPSAPLLDEVDRHIGEQLRSGLGGGGKGSKQMIPRNFMNNRYSKNKKSHRKRKSKKKQKK